MKLSEDKSKISLSIFTSSTQTAKLINDEVVSLQNALRPLHTEVQQVVVMPNEHTAEYAAQSSMEHRGQFSGQQFSNNSQGHQSSSAQTQDSSEFESVVQTIAEEGLDTYI